MYIDTALPASYASDKRLSEKTLPQDAGTFSKALDLKIAQQKEKEFEEKKMLLGFVLETVLEPMIPKEGPFASKDAQLFFSMYFSEEMKSERMINDFGFGEELNA